MKEIFWLVFCYTRTVKGNKWSELIILCGLYIDSSNVNIDVHLNSCKFLGDTIYAQIYKTATLFESMIIFLPNRLYIQRDNLENTVFG